MDMREWERTRGKQSMASLNAFLQSRADSYAILQLKDVAETTQLQFMSHGWLDRKGFEPQFKNYGVVYEGILPADMSLEGIFFKFNVDHPVGFTGHSLSVSDVVLLKRDGNVTCHYTDNIGFRPLENFLPEKYLRVAEASQGRKSVLQNLNDGRQSEKPARAKTPQRGGCLE